ncbi:MAG: FG-GAP-like repeat-containing protein [Pedosphaera sp.]|nr:FG-GAP-like repeat-containing protein [Pedosphaera sp.]
MSSRKSKLLPIGIITVVLIAIAIYFKFNRTEPDKTEGIILSKKSPPVLGLLPEFELTDQAVETFGSRQLRGKAWIANFIFTRCTATCPAQTAKISEFQGQLQDSPLWDEVRFVSFTVDPEHDTPQVLSEYAKNANADAQHWKFLTGEREAIWRLSKDGFKLPVSENTDPTIVITHSPKVMLVDPYLRIRGIYEVTTKEGLARLRHGLDQVLMEKVPEPEEAINPPWLAARREAQLKTVDKFKVVHDFSFTDGIEESGILFRNKIVDDVGKNYIPVHYDHGNGLAIADVDGDGNLDLYFVTQAGSNGLWRNLGNGRFEDITEQAGVAVENKIGVTASFADIDNDGDPDLYTTTVRGGNMLFENLGSGQFKDISQASGLNHNGHSSAAVFFDYNRDGLLDVYLTNVGKYTSDKVLTVTMEQARGEKEAEYKFFAGFADAFSGHLPEKKRSERSILFKNLGNNRFEDISKKVKLQDESWTGDASPVDFNQDGWIDLYVLNMQGDDQYYVNVEGEYFEKKSREVFPLTPWGAMGVKTFDFENDGDMDLFITDMHSDMSEQVGPERESYKSRQQWPESMLLTQGKSIWGNAFYRNNGKGNFEEVSDQIGAENYWPWGISVGDLNADGFDDVFIASSMNFPFRYAVNSLLLNNQGSEFLSSEFILGVEPRPDGRFAEPWFELDCDGEDKDHALAKGRSGRAVIWSALGTRSSVMFDLDNDGDLDIVTNEFNSRPMVLISNLSEKHDKLNYLKVKLVGEKSNRDGLGAVVRVRTGSQTYMKVHDGQSGYLSQSLYPLYFGLNEVTNVDEIKVTWPSGNKQTVLGPIDVNRTIEVKEQ